MERKYIGLINSQQTFTNDTIKIENENNAIQNITEDQLGLINNNFEYLKNLLAVDQRSISYLDIYRIDKILSDQDINNIATEFALLSPGHSLGINGFVSFNNEEYKKGDILLKLVNGQPLHISGPTGGMFVPLLEASDTEIKIKWYYSRSITMLDEEYIFLGNFSNDSDANTVLSLMSSDYYFYYNITDNLYKKTYYTSGTTPQWTSWDPNGSTTEKFFQYSYTIPRLSATDIVRYNRQYNRPDGGWGRIFTGTNGIDIPVITTANDQILYPIIKYFIIIDDIKKEEVICTETEVYSQTNTTATVPYDYWCIEDIPSYIDSIMIY